MLENYFRFPNSLPFLALSILFDLKKEIPADVIILPFFIANLVHF